MITEIESVHADCDGLRRENERLREALKVAALESDGLAVDAERMSTYIRTLLSQIDGERDD